MSAESTPGDLRRRVTSADQVREICQARSAAPTSLTTAWRMIPGTNGSSNYVSGRDSTSPRSAPKAVIEDGCGRATLPPTWAERRMLGGLCSGILLGLFRTTRHRQEIASNAIDASVTMLPVDGGCALVATTVFAMCRRRTGPIGAARTPTGWPAGADYPIEWNAQQNILWQIDLPAHAGSTPIVWGEQIFVTVADDGKNLARCYDWQGKLQWQTEVGTERPGKHKKASGCNSSPITDGQHVYVYFKSGDLACLDLQGEIIWRTNLQKEFAEDTLWWDLGTSPVLTEDHLVVAVIQSGPSYLVAFDKNTGCGGLEGRPA